MVDIEARFGEIVKEDYRTKAYRVLDDFIIQKNKNVPRLYRDAKGKEVPEKMVFTDDTCRDLVMIINAGFDSYKIEITVYEKQHFNIAMEAAEEIEGAIGSGVLLRKRFDE